MNRGLLHTAWLTLVLFSGCFGIERPRVSDSAMAVTVFEHQDLQQSCASCHERNRPGTPHGRSPASQHGGGQDCSSCHDIGSWIRPTLSPHPDGNSSLQECASCHEPNRPTRTLFPAPGPMVQTHFESSDCVACHAPKSLDVPAFTFDHVRATTASPTCLPCHEARLPAGGTRFNHLDYRATDCIQCHRAPSTGEQPSWSGATYEHSPALSSCNGCHAGDRPATAMYSDGKVVNGHHVTKDCASCHQPKSATATVFRFAHSDSKNTNIGFCLPCHTTEGKAVHGTGGSQQFTGDGNCFTCHNVKRKSFATR